MKLDFAKWFTPKDKTFTPLFAQGANHVLEAGKMLVRLLKEQDAHKRNALIQEIDELESANDSVTHHIKQALSKTFITPFDREDIHQLASLVDDVIDLINVVGKKIHIYNMEPQQDEAVQKLATLIEEACHAIYIILGDISSIKKDIREGLLRVHTIENEADDLHDKALKKLFEQESDARTIIKQKEIYKHLESITDKCEEVMHVMESIHIKYS